MKFRKKYKLLSIIDPDNEALKRELGEYEFDGAVDFTKGPTFVFDMENLIVLPHEVESSDFGTKVFIEEEGKVINIAGDNTKFFQSQSLRLGRYFSLQDFFDKNKDASCIVFYVDPEHPGTIFHSGNIIRVAVIE